MKDPEYRMVMIASSSFFLFSALLHFPASGLPPLYSDIVNVFWFQRPYILSGVPYVNYVFEYPPICGLILWLGASASGGNLYIFTLVEFSILFAFMVFLTHVLYKFISALGIDHNRQLLFVAFAPSILIYGAYNFDIVQTALVTFALYLFIVRKRFYYSAVVLGLAIATKTAPVLLVPIFLQDLKGWEKRIRYLSLTTVVAFSLNAPFMILNFQNWLGGYEFIRNWGLEDTFLVWIFGNSSTWTIAKLVSLLLIAFASISVYFVGAKKPLIVRAFLLSGLFILFSYISTPQMNIDLLPFFALVPIVPYSVFIPFEIFDAGIIITWFSFQFSNLPGIPQSFALVRQVYLALILVLVANNKTPTLEQSKQSKEVSVKHE
ncbi:MAG: hypothetical protein ACYCQJ_07290 [Nitrososphaerales archaeon]